MILIKKINLWVLLMGLLLSVNANAQNNGTIFTYSAYVSRGGDSAVSGATITLCYAKDSAVYKITNSSTEGIFSISIPAENSWLLIISSVGYIKKWIRIDSGSRADLLPQKILLEKDKQVLGEIIISSRSNPIQYKDGKIIFNTENNITNSGGSAADFLSALPNVSALPDGTLRMNGKNQVLILIDGKAQPANGPGPIGVLKGIPASDIAKIEVINNPSSRYDASGNAGIINIITKKVKKQGLNAIISNNFTLGYYPKYTGNINISYKKKTLSFYASYAHSNQKNKFFGLLSRKSNLSGLVIDESRDKINSYDFIRAGADWNITDKQTLSAGSRLNIYTRNEPYYSATSTEGNSIYTNGKLKDKYTNISPYISYELNIDSTGKKVTMDLDYTNFNNPITQNYKSSFFNSSNAEYRVANNTRNALNGTTLLYSGKLDVELPLKRNLKIDAGVKASRLKTNNDIMLDTLSGNVWIPDIGNSNRFIYTETIMAAYINAGKQLKKLMLQAGLRVENTNLTGNQKNGNKVFNRSYLNLFPSLQLMYQLNSNNQLMLGYVRRLDRPVYEMLNPFTYFSDPYNATEGNPNLYPQYTNTINAAHTYKDWLNTGISFTRIKNIITQLPEYDVATNISYARYFNLGQMDILSFTTGFNKNVTKHWNTSNNFAVNYSDINTPDFLGKKLNNSLLDFSCQLNQSFTITPSLSAELNASYNSPIIYGYFRLKRIVDISGGIQKTLLKKKATLRFSFSDLTWGQKEFLTGEYYGQLFSVRNIRDSRTVRLGFIYRFGKKVTQLKQRTAASADETQRLKQ
jgi:hypothetical protein